MTQEIEYEQFEQGDGAESGISQMGADVDLRRVSEVPMELSVEIGRTHMTVGETLDLRNGSIVVLDRLAGEPVDLLVNGTPIARGEVVVVDDKFGLRVREILESHDAPAAATAAGAGAFGVGDDPALEGELTGVDG